MKKYFIALTGLLIVSCLSGAAPAEANHQNDLEDTNEGESRYEDYTRWFSSRYDSRVDDLDDDPVENLYLPVILGLELDDMIANYGDPRGGGTRSHEGQDLIAPRWSPVVSPTEAVVINITDGDSSGLTVYTANPGGERFAYMHLEYIPDYLEEGDRLQVGDLIGFNGDSGNAQGTVTHVHFEIRDNGPTDPYPRLTKEFSDERKAEIIDNFWSDLDSDEQEDIARNLLLYFKTELESFNNRGYELPKDITDLLSGDRPAPVVSQAEIDIDDIDLDDRLRALVREIGRGLPSSNLSIGSDNSGVVWLQKFLINEETGPAGDRLSAVSATGYYGSITAAALSEYQLVNGLATTGEYDSQTRFYLFLFGL